MSKVKTHYIVLMVDFNGKVGKKQAGDLAVGDYGISSRDSRGELLECAERNDELIVNIFFRKLENRKWARRTANGVTKKETDFIQFCNPDIVQDVEVLARVRCSDHIMVTSGISLDLRSKRKKLVWKKPINELVVRGKIEEFRISLQNRYSALTEETNLSVQAMSDSIASIITESALAVGGNVVRQDTGKISQETKDLIMKL